MLVNRREQSVNLHWIAEYLDGSTLNESKVSYVNLPRDNLVSFSLLNDKDEPVVSVSLSKDRVLFYRMRVTLNLSGIATRTYILGYRTQTGQTKLYTVTPFGEVKEFNSFAEAKTLSNLKPPSFFTTELLKQ
jgi:hypothetical protein